MHVNFNEKNTSILNKELKKDKGSKVNGKTEKRQIFITE